jgi:hypothetical protein
MRRGWLAFAALILGRLYLTNFSAGLFRHRFECFCEELAVRFLFSYNAAMFAAIFPAGMKFDYSRFFQRDTFHAQRISRLVFSSRERKRGPKNLGYD